MNIKMDFKEFLESDKSPEELISQMTNPVNEGQHLIQQIKQIVKNKTAEKIDGVIVDLYTASAIEKVYDALRPDLQRKFSQLDISQIADISLKMLR